MQYKFKQKELKLQANKNFLFEDPSLKKNKNRSSYTDKMNQIQPKNKLRFSSTMYGNGINDQKFLNKMGLKS